MVLCCQLRLKAVAAGVAVVLLLALAGLAEGQVLHGPDLGVWFRHQRDAGGASALIVDELLEDGPFAAAGLREGDEILSVDGRPIGSEPQFVRGVMRSSKADHVVSLVAARGEEQQTISLKSRDVWNGVVAADPFYQAGFLLDERDREAMVVLRVFPLTPAFYAGLRPGDVITSVSGQNVTLPADVAEYFRVGGRRQLVVMRGGESRALHLLLPSRRPLAATTEEITGVQRPRPFVPNPVPMPTHPPLLIPPPIPGPLSPIPSALPRNTERRLPF